MFFSSIICFFEYAQNELYYANERSTCLKRNVINFRNNTILADPYNKARDIIYGFRKELEEVKKELGNKRNCELSILTIQDKIIKYQNTKTLNN
ncbi:fam-b protein [Plasmodium yoelii]|uniref:Fam-b protein n=2 Tax=Plasmodium yoelii TaxID=5861 RepID=A0AAE9WK14_PLAYO|nr:fam-b protein [Plasmodium yoelii]WBY55105.1 fam-b protein [Plasmodium yoelii yoelii]CDU16361.1 fam-b protein [Plasmodium yoelii]VTZ72679.1 fam-b protein [Plasmodium yoelii]|eukprot:XP_022811494.1 fam-b protein [Plasmodium yoelii]